MTAEAAVSPSAGRPYDQAARRKLSRVAASRDDLRLTIPREVLAGLGFAPGEAVYARLWPDPNRPRLTVNLYREP